MLPPIAGIPNVASLQLAVSALPGYVEALNDMSDCDAWLSIPPNLPAVDPALAAQSLNKWVDAKRSHETALAEYEARRRIVQSRRDAAANQAQSAFGTGADLVLGVLHDDLTKLLRRAAEMIPDLNGAMTAAEAIEADAGAAWKRLGELANEYAELREAQTFVMVRAASGIWQSATPQFPAEDHANLCYLRNIDDLWPNWRQPGLSRSRIDLSDSTRRARQEPWPADHGPELLLWIVTSGADAWIPTGKQLRELWAERNAPAPAPAPAPVEDDAPQGHDDDSRDSLLIGPLLVERDRQIRAAKAAQAPRKRADYNRIARPIRSKRQPTEPKGADA